MHVSLIGCLCLGLCSRIPRLFTAKLAWFVSGETSPCLDVPVSFHPLPSGGCLGCFQVLAVVSGATVRCMRVSMWAYPLLWVGTKEYSCQVIW